MNISKLHGKNLTLNQIEALKEIRNYVQFKRFGASMRIPVTTIKDCDQATQFIKENTKLYFDTWVIPLLNLMIDGKES